MGVASLQNSTPYGRVRHDVWSNRNPCAWHTFCLVAPLQGGSSHATAIGLRGMKREALARSTRDGQQPYTIVGERTSTMSAKVIAVVDADDATRHMLDVLLREAGFQVISSASVPDAQQFILRTLPDLVLLDLWLEDRNAGVQIMGALGRDPLTRDISVILCTGRVEVVRAHGPMLHALGYGVQEKPFDPPALLAKIRVALARNQTTYLHRMGA